MMPATADKRVVAWLDVQPRTQFSTTSLNYAESLYGVARLTDGQRKHNLYIAVRRTYRALFDGRILPFDSQAAREYAFLLAERRHQGRPLLEFDAQIAAIARARKLPIATRDSDFADCGIDVINPWDYAGP